MSTDASTDFEPHRRHLRALAYRMLGSRAEAEDVVQDCWLRWRDADHAAVRDARAYLSQTATHLCLDRLGSARQRREQYVGVWLPEPLVQDTAHYQPGPEVATEYAQDVSMAFMLTLERLSPLERAAFLLHDVFDLAFDDVAQRLQRSPAACRQLASRARTHVRAGYARVEVSAEQGERLLQAFGQALAQGDIEALSRTLADDAEFFSDGGGEVCAVPQVLHGSAHIAKALIGFARSGTPGRQQWLPARVNGMPGAVHYDHDGAVIQTIALRIHASGRIASVYFMRSPSKLAHLSRAPGMPG